MIKELLKEVEESVWSLVKSLTVHQRMIAAGIVVGAAAGFGAFLFDRLIVFFDLLTLSRLEGATQEWKTVGLLIFPPLGAVLGALLIHFFAPEAKGHGVNEVYNAISKEEGKIPGRVAWAKLVASALTIGLGGSAGREGPAIQIGGAVGSWIGRTLRVETRDLRMLVAAGACAGLGVSFGVPLAAVFFTMEVLLRDIASESFPAVVIAAVSGLVTATAFMGGKNYTASLAYSWNGPLDFTIYALMGLLCAPFGVFYMRFMHMVERWTKNETRWPEWLKPMWGGVVVGLIALVLPEVMGTGQSVIDTALQGSLFGWKAGALTLAKIVSTAATLGTGGSGGAFMPAIFIGGAAGSAWGVLIHHLFGVAVVPGALALVGIACVVTSAYRAPVTAIILALEMSHDFGLLLPIMFACIIAHLSTYSPKPTPAPVLEQ